MSDKGHFRPFLDTFRIHFTQLELVLFLAVLNFEGAYNIISQRCGVLKANPMVASSPPLTRAPDANKKNEIRSAQSQDISSLNLGVVN
jgi:hypothetical protein